jgi:hypothetical protein
LVEVVYYGTPSPPRWAPFFGQTFHKKVWHYKLKLPLP